MGAAGSASAPVITRTGDTNTGIFFPAADTIAFAEGGVEALRLDSAGNMGLGTTSPRNVSGYKNLVIDGSTSGLFEINTNGTRVFSLYGAGNDINLVNPTATGTMQFYTNNTERMRLDASGNLGIGTTSPAISGYLLANIKGGASILTLQVQAEVDSFLFLQQVLQIMRLLFTIKQQRQNVPVSTPAVTCWWV